MAKEAKTLKEQLSLVVNEYAEKTGKKAGYNVEDMLKDNTSMGQTISFLTDADFNGLFEAVGNDEKVREGKFTFTNKAPRVVSFQKDRDSKEIHYPVFQLKNDNGRLFKISLGAMTKHMESLDELGDITIKGKLSTIESDHNAEYGTTRFMIESIK